MRFGTVGILALARQYDVKDHKEYEPGPCWPPTSVTSRCFECSVRCRFEVGTVRWRQVLGLDGSSVVVSVFIQSNVKTKVRLGSLSPSIRVYLPITIRLSILRPYFSPSILLSVHSSLRPSICLSVAASPSLCTFVDIDASHSLLSVSLSISIYLSVALSLSMSNGIFMRTRQTQVRHFCLKRYKTRYTPVKRDRIKNPRRGQHPERDQNEIGARFKFA